jgi:hypothetical protein
MRLFARNSIEVGKMEQYVISPVIPQRAHLGSETRFSRRQLVSRGSPEEASASRVAVSSSSRPNILFSYADLQ